MGTATPAAHRGPTVIRYAFGQSSLGEVLLARSDKGVCALALGDSRAALLDELHGRFPHAQLCESGEELSSWMARAVSVVDGVEASLGLPLDPQGTLFQERVWKALCQIPAGQKRSYSELAASLDAPTAARAVAGACAANTLAIVIPCHRVVRADGSLSGYRWGSERKRLLLDRERTARPVRSTIVGQG